VMAEALQVLGEVGYLNLPSVIREPQTTIKKFEAGVRLPIELADISQKQSGAAQNETNRREKNEKARDGKCGPWVCNHEEVAWRGTREGKLKLELICGTFREGNQSR